MCSKSGQDAWQVQDHSGYLKRPKHLKKGNSVWDLGIISALIKRRTIHCTLLIFVLCFLLFFLLIFPHPRIFENGFHTRVHTAWNLLCRLGCPQVCGDCPCLQSIGTASLQAPCLVSFPFVTQFFLAIKDRVFVMSLLVTRGRNPTHTGVCQKGKPGGNCDRGSMKTRDLRFFFFS